MAKAEDVDGVSIVVPANPLALTTISYDSPPATSNENAPSAFVTAFRSARVTLFLRRTTAPAIGLFAASATTPSIAPVCAKPEIESKINNENERMILYFI